VAGFTSWKWEIKSWCSSTCI